MAWFDPTPTEKAAIAELESLSDRAAAVVGGSILDAVLLAAIKTKLKDFEIKKNDSLHGRMFANSQPLGSFSSRINMGFMLDLYDGGIWKELDTIRAIRNDFAHSLEVSSFENARGRCENLKACELYFKESIKGSIEDITVLTKHGKIPTITMYVRGLYERLKIPRQRYLLSVKYYHFVLKYSVFWAGRSNPYLSD